MKRLFTKLRLYPPTITRDLTVGLMIVITLVFTLAGTANYFYSVDRDTKALYDKANEIMENLASVLVSPMWDLNTAELQKVVDVYRQSGIVLDIRVVDDTGAELVPPRRTLGDAYIEMTRVIHHDKEAIGRVTVSFSGSDITAKQRQVAAYSLVVFSFLTVALIAVTTLLLRRFLARPFRGLKDGLALISEGDYAHKFEPVRQVDIADITAKVSLMAGEIAKREAALEANRTKLEILNQAILDIFSCSDTETLIRTTLVLTNKVCGVEQGWFLGTHAAAVPGEEEKQSSPPPLVCVRGHMFEATEGEVEPHIGQQDNVRTFTFVIKSRYRIVGRLTVAFDVPPDPSVTSLLKSLMSLATLAMIRQSFIRETAFIAAELQVAETVQRSMLLDDARLPARAAVSYHYEPVLRVGGDWFSVIESKGGNSLYIILGDVTGHGLAQGLVTTAMAGAINVVESMIQVEVDHMSRPSQIVTQLNNVVRKLAGKSNLRMTCVAAQIDFRNMRLSICNAAHTFPLLLHQHPGCPPKVESLAKNQQYMLGDDTQASVDHVYTDATYEFHESDLLLFYTDGLTEAVDQEGKPFMRKFHRHFSKMGSDRTVAQLKDELLTLFRSHTNDVPVKDDICLLIVGKKPDKAVQAA